MKKSGRKMRPLERFNLKVVNVKINCAIARRFIEHQQKLI